MVVTDPRVVPWAIDESRFPGNGPYREQIRFLLRYAVLAPSIYNTQPWLFTLLADGMAAYHNQRCHLPCADSPRAWIACGQALQRFLLLTEEGLYGAFHNEPVQVPDTRLALRSLLGIDDWPQLVLRVGYTQPSALPTARRSIDQVMREASNTKVLFPQSDNVLFMQYRNVL